MKQVMVTTPNKTYPIVVTEGFDTLQDVLQERKLTGRKMCILADETTANLYGEVVGKSLEQVSSALYSYTFPAGEQQKTLETISQFYEFFQQNRFDRKTVLVALGGGVCGDMTGFAAATYLRGIPFVQIPTTLLAQVDSSVGGKTGVDFHGAKNSIGAFYQPEFVYINTKTLETLPKREFGAGMAEVIKYGCILSSAFLTFLEEKKDKLLALDHAVLADVVAKCCQYKADVVSEDEKESGLREILNFGHTIGHGIETSKGFRLLHGECVALGMLGVYEMARQRGEVTKAELERVKALLSAFGLPTETTGIAVENVYQQMFLDKKVKDNKIGFVLPKGIGQVYRTTEVTKEEILTGIQFVVKDRVE